MELVALADEGDGRRPGVQDGREDVVTAVLDRGLHPLATLVRRSTLEDVFLRLTGRSLAD